MVEHGNDPIIIREAQKSDNEGLLELTSISPMMGRIAIRTDRNPDFFNLLDLRGNYIVYVALNHHKIIGSISAAGVQVFVDSQPEVVYYVGDFKIHPGYRKTNLGIRLVKRMWQFLVSKDADILFSTVAFGNHHVLPFFQGRINLPFFETAGIFKVFQMIPVPWFFRSFKYTIRKIPQDPDLPAIFNEFTRKYQFGPVINDNSLRDTTIYSASENGKIVAMISLFDPAGAKQNVLIRLPAGLNIIVKTIRGLNKLLPVVNLPGENEPVKILYIKTFYIKNGYEDAFRLLIRLSRNIAFKSKYSFLTIGLHENDPLTKSLGRFPKFIFRSQGLTTSLKNSKRVNSILARGIPFEDYSLV